MEAENRRRNPKYDSDCPDDYVCVNGRCVPDVYGSSSPSSTSVEIFYDKNGRGRVLTAGIDYDPEELDDTELELRELEKLPLWKEEDLVPRISSAEYMALANRGYV